MKLELTNFRCYVNKTYHFPEHQITLLKGEPGDGKTTVFNAIWWVLYGHLRAVGHRMSTVKRTTVKITFDQLSSLGKGVSIQRQNHPNKFILTIDQPIYGSNGKESHQGEIAQQLINRVFGSKDTWGAVSYILQGEQCVLLSGSKQDRLKLLESISFHEDDPKEAINKIDRQLNIEREKFKLMENSFQKECQRLTEELSKGPAPQNSSTERLSQLKQELSKYQEKLNREQLLERERFKLIGLSNHLQNEIKTTKLDAAFQFTRPEMDLKLKNSKHQIQEIEGQLEETRLKIAHFEATEGKDSRRVEEQLKSTYQQKQLYLNNLKLIERDRHTASARHIKTGKEIESSQLEISSMDNYLLTLRSWIESENVRLSPLPENSGWPTLLQLGQITQIERDRQINVQRASNMKIEYSPSIPSLLNQREGRLRSLEEQSMKSSMINKIISLRSKARELQTELSLIDEGKVINTIQDAHILQSKLGKMVINKRTILRDKEGSAALLFCPKCNQSLSIKNGNLTSDSRLPVTPDEIEQLKIYIFKLTQLDKHISTLLSSWDGITIVPDQMIDLNKINQPIQILRTEIQNLRQIRWIPSPKMDSVRCSSLVTLKSKTEEEENMIQKKRSLNQIIQQKSLRLAEIREKIDQRTTEIEKLSLEMITPIDRKIIGLEQERDVYARKLSVLPVAKWKNDVEVLKQKINQIRNMEGKFKMIISKQEILTDQLKSKELEISHIVINLHNLGKSLLRDIQAEIETKNQNLISLQRGIYISEWQKRLTIDRDELINQQSSLADLEELRKIAERVEYQRLIETITSINSTMNQLFRSLFDDEITVQLELFKKLKTKNRTKPQVNCLVHYGGSTYEYHPTSISGGEKNRLNLGMILALNLVSSSPLVLLDECTCFLNERLKIQCMESVREMMGQCKTIICVAHEDNEAYYDNIIQVLPKILPEMDPKHSFSLRPPGPLLMVTIQNNATSNPKLDLQKKS